jgi:bisanhydrobacterioruberin hydratase
MRFSLYLNVLEKNRQQTATFIALLFHGCGLTGILLGNDFFIKTTPINLILMFLLLLWTQSEKSRSFYLFMGIAILTGLVSEIIGVNTGMLFGDYHYTHVLGPAVKGVPLVIGINWFVLSYCSGVAVYMLHQAVLKKWDDAFSVSPALRVITLVFDAALLMVLFDWVMEPAAIKLGFWQWAGSGEPPALNYWCWFAIATFLLGLFSRCKFNRKHQFAVHLLLIQWMFFLIISTLL